MAQTYYMPTPKPINKCDLQNMKITPNMIRVGVDVIKYFLSEKMDRHLHSYILLNTTTSQSAGYIKKSTAISLVKDHTKSSAATAYRILNELKSIGFICENDGVLKITGKKVSARSISKNKRYIKLNDSLVSSRDTKRIIGTMVAILANRLEGYLVNSNRVKKGAVKWISGVPLKSLANHIGISISRISRILQHGDFIVKKNFQFLYCITKGEVNIHKKYHDLNFAVTIGSNSRNMATVKRRLGNSYFPL